MFFVKCLPILMMIMMLSGCSPNSVPTPDHVGKVDSAVIVVPGYYGTRLVRESDGSLVFISLSQVLFGDQSLTIPVPGLGFEGTIDLQPDGIFDEFRVVPLSTPLTSMAHCWTDSGAANNKNREVIPLPMIGGGI